MSKHDIMRWVELAFFLLIRAVNYVTKSHAKQRTQLRDHLHDHFI